MRQIPNHKFQINYNYQNSNIQISVIVFDFGHWDFDIVCDLVIGICNFKKYGISV